MSIPGRPKPVVTVLGEPFWAACNERRLVAQRCLGCQQLRHYPQERCPLCYAAEYDWAPLSGRGEVYSYTVSHRPFHPAWQEHAPYVVATIELEEGVRMVSDLIGADPDSIKIGQGVEITFEALDDFGLIPRFRVVKD